MSLAPLLSTGALVFTLSGCLVEPELRVLDWDLSPGRAGRLTAEFQTEGPVFREPLSLNAWELSIAELHEARTNNLLFYYVRGQGDEKATASIEILTTKQVRLTTPRLPDDFPPAPYVLRLGVRGGEAAEPGWPAVQGRVQFGTPLVE
jgi:hypothetical protein